MLLIISAHVALIALAMSARMEFQKKQEPNPPLIKVPIDRPLPQPSSSNHPAQHPQPRPISDPTQNFPLPHPDPVPLGPGPTIDPGPIVNGGGDAFPYFPPKPVAGPVRHDPRLLTPPSELRPPYPDSKILSEEEATLQLRLTISASGRVIAVDPVGPADRVFLDAARRYLIAHWRYQPATEDGHAVDSAILISLRFQLNG
jgi:protein TonB